MVTIIKTVLSFLAPLIDKIFGRNTERALELKAQKELEELQAFKAGRITPRFLLFYILVGIFAIFAILLIASLFFPQWLNVPDAGQFRVILDLGAGIME